MPEIVARSTDSIAAASAGRIEVGHETVLMTAAQTERDQRPHGFRRTGPQPPTWSELIVRATSPAASWETAFAVRGVIWDDRSVLVRGHGPLTSVTSAARRIRRAHRRRRSA